MSKDDEGVPVICTECDYENSVDSIYSAAKIAGKHSDHTGHEVDWKNIMQRGEITDEDKNKVYKIVCETCDEDWDFTSRSDAKEFNAEHAAHTDHRADSLETTELDILNESTLIAIVWGMQKVENPTIEEVVELLVTAGLSEDNARETLYRHQGSFFFDDDRMGTFLKS